MRREMSTRGKVSERERERERERDREREREVRPLRQFSFLFFPFFFQTWVRREMRT